jgi:hypothetical protein
MWYLIGILVPVAAVASVSIIARHLHSGAVFLPLAALPLTLGLKVFTGAMGEELGWRGFLLSHLERSISLGSPHAQWQSAGHSGTFRNSFFPVCRNSTCLRVEGGTIRHAFSGRCRGNVGIPKDQRVWKRWEAGITAFHAFHTLSFPPPAFRGANAGPNRNIVRMMWDVLGSWNGPFRSRPTSRTPRGLRFYIGGGN